MSKASVFSLALVFVACVCLAPAGYSSDEVQETPLYGESLDKAKKFSDSDAGIQAKPVEGAADGMQTEYPWPTVMGENYTCGVAMPTCVGYPTCCWEGLTCQGPAGSTCDADAICNSQTIGWGPTCSQATCEGGDFTCLSGQWTCNFDQECEPYATLYGFRTCGWWPTCWMGPTCTGNYTCGYRGFTCGGYLTCNRATWDSHPTCGGKPTCTGDTCWPLCNPTILAAQLTCDAAFLTCQAGLPTCIDGLITCDITCRTDFPTCQAAPTCWAGGVECDGGYDDHGVPGLSPVGSVMLILSLGALVVLFMYRRRKANQKI